MSDIYDLPTATIAPVKLPYAKVHMLCEYRMCNGLCGRKVLASKDKPLCYQHYSRKKMMTKCAVQDCENGTLSASGHCAQHDQNAANMRLRRKQDKFSGIVPLPKKPELCACCNIEVLNMSMHNKTNKHCKNLFYQNIQCDFTRLKKNVIAIRS